MVIFKVTMIWTYTKKTFDFLNYRRHKNILLEAHNAIFYSLPKNGCSSMKAQIVELLNLPKSPNFPTDVHEPTVYNYPFVHKKKLNSTYKNYLRFCFVRNPWDRLFSCFNDKIKPKNYNHPEYFSGVARCLFAYDSRFYGGMSFEEFVELVCSIPDTKAEHHFQSQLFQMTDKKGNLLVNYIGNLEFFAEDLAEIAMKTGIPFAQTPHLRKTKKENYQDFYTEKMRKKMEKRFAADVEFFGYEFEQLHPKNRINFFTTDDLRQVINSNSFYKMKLEKRQYKKSFTEHKADFLSDVLSILKSK